MEEHEKYGALRRQRAPQLESRLAPLSEVAGPQRSDRTVRRSAGDGLPTLASPSLAGSAGEAVDAGTLSFLTAQALEAKRKEEQKVSQRQQVDQGRVEGWAE